MEVLEDGSVWYYYEKKFDLTDLIDDKGNCKFMFVYNGETFYVSCSLGQSEESVLNEEQGIFYTSGYESTIGKEALQDAQEYVLAESL